MNPVAWVEKHPLMALLGAAATVGGIVLVARASAAPTPLPPTTPPTPGQSAIPVDITTTSVSLVSGHRYQLTVTDPFVAGFSSSTTFIPIAQSGFDNLLGKNVLAIRSAQIVGSTAIMTVDYTGTGPLLINAAALHVASATIADLGAV